MNIFSTQSRTATRLWILAITVVIYTQV